MMQYLPRDLHITNEEITLLNDTIFQFSNLLSRNCYCMLTTLSIYRISFSDHSTDSTQKSETAELVVINYHLFANQSMWDGWKLAGSTFCDSRRDRYLILIWTAFPLAWQPMKLLSWCWQKKRNENEDKINSPFHIDVYVYITESENA